MTGTRLYIGGVRSDVEESDVRRFFGHNQKIRKILLKDGYGFVHFENFKDANAALLELNGKKLLGDTIVLELAKEPRSSNGFMNKPNNGYSTSRSNREDYNNRFGQQQHTKYRVIVENLPKFVSWKDLKRLMDVVGKVTFAEAHKKNRNEGFVEFASYSDMRAAIDMVDGEDLNGRCLRVREDKTVTKVYRSNRRSRYSPEGSLSSDKSYRSYYSREYIRSRSGSSERFASSARSYSSKRCIPNIKSFENKRSRTRLLSPEKSSKFTTTSRFRSLSDAESKHSSQTSKCESRSRSRSRNFSISSSEIGNEDKARKRKFIPTSSSKSPNAPKRSRL